MTTTPMQTKPVLCIVPREVLFDRRLIVSLCMTLLGIVNTPCRFPAPAQFPLSQSRPWYSNGETSA
jgi:hypothetical protein